MGVEALVSSHFVDAHVLSIKDYIGSTSTSTPDSSAPCYLRLSKWTSIRAYPSIRTSFFQIGHRRRPFICEASSRKIKDVAANLGCLDLKAKRKNLAVFVSGGGSNFKAIHAATLNGSILGDVVALVTNKQGCGGAAYARENGIPVLQFPKSKEPEGLSVGDLITTLRKFEVDFIFLAGYLKLIPVELVRNYPKRILNIHPSLLPAFGGKGYYGLKVHQAVIASGARFSGPTIHFVDEEYDTGRILAQRVVPVRAFDTPEELSARVLNEEHILYVDTVAALCEDRIMWRYDGVPIIRSKEDPDHFS